MSRRSRRRAVWISVALVLSVASAASAAPGDLDPTFGGDGIVRTDVSRFTDSAFAHAIQADGKIVAVGINAFEREDARFVVLRYETDGSLDPTFGGDGIVRTNLSRTSDGAWGVGIQSDGKIVVAGDVAFGSGDSKFGVVRYDTDGTLDITYGGGDGKIVVDFTRRNDPVASAAIQADDKLVVAGAAASNGRNPKFAVARFDTDGTLDGTFGNDGKVATDLTRNLDWANDVAIHTDGSIVATGVSVGASWRTGVVRYGADGSLDPTFGGDGKVVMAVRGRDTAGSGVAVQTDGKVVVTGSVGPFRSSRFALLRFAADGALDDTFGGDGVVTTSFSRGSDAGADVAVQTDGTIVVAGWVEAFARGARTGIARYETGGALDGTFGAGGMTTIELGRRNEVVRNVRLDADGKIVLSGGAGGRIVVARMLAA